MAARVPVGIRELFDLSRVGGFDLPATLIETYAAIVRVSEIAIEPLNVLDINQATERINATVRRGELDDLFAVGQEIEAGSRDRAAMQSGEQAKRVALERIAEELTTLCADLTEEIIRNHLRPAFESVLEEARGPAEVIHQHLLTAKELMLREDDSARGVRQGCAHAGGRWLTPFGRVLILTLTDRRSLLDRSPHRISRDSPPS